MPIFFYVAAFLLGAAVVCIERGVEALIARGGGRDEENKRKYLEHQLDQLAGGELPPGLEQRVRKIAREAAAPIPPKSSNSA